MLVEYTLNNINNGRSRFSYLIKLLVSQNEPVYFELLDINNDNIFLEPLLFMYFNNSESKISLKQILFGYIEDCIKPAEVKVYSDLYGRIYMPNTGYFKTGIRNDFVLLKFNEDKGYLIEHNGEPVAYEFEGLNIIKCGDIELVTHNNNLLEECFRDSAGNIIPVEIERITGENENHIAGALSIIEKYYPKYFSLMKSEVKKIVIFHSPKINSFAAIYAHGTAFINVTENSNEIFFVEDLLHQCGHVIFSSLTVEKGNYFNIDPDSPLSVISKDDEEQRTLYSAFHGLFTEAVMNECLDKCIDQNVFGKEKEHEAAARLGYILLRFNEDIKTMDCKEVYSDEGWKIIGYLKDCYTNVYNKRVPVLKKFNYTNQPYTFSYKCFLNSNPYPVHESVVDKQVNGHIR